MPRLYWADSAPLQRKRKPGKMGSYGKAGSYGPGDNSGTMGKDEQPRLLSGVHMYTLGPTSVHAYTIHMCTTR